MLPLAQAFGYLVPSGCHCLGRFWNLTKDEPSCKKWISWWGEDGLCKIRFNSTSAMSSLFPGTWRCEQAML